MDRESLVSAMGRFVLVVVCAVSAGAVAAADPEQSRLFHPPVRLQADGADIDTGEVWGHSGPCLADADGDGRRDLVVGDFSGKFRFYRNAGSNDKPAYAAVKYLTAGDTEAQVHIYCCIGSSPHFVDWDADGKLDFISGSYDPGECYLFRGRGEGKYAERETIVDKTGKPVLRNPDQKQDYQSFGSWPVTVDWDDDGDLDLLVGAFDGTMVVRLNEGTRREPKFAATNLAVHAAGKELKAPGKSASHAAPAVTDWDGDGRWDILSGSDSGAVYFYRNVGDAGRPKFAAEQVLVVPHDGNGEEVLLEADAEPVPGIRAQIAVADYNQDGKVDLLVGDFCTTITPRRDLTAAERDEMNSIRKELKDGYAMIANAIEDLRKEFKQRYPGDAVYSDEADAEWSKASMAMRERDIKPWQTKSKELEQSLGKYLIKPEREGTFNPFATTRGYVWLFVRR